MLNCRSCDDGHLTSIIALGELPLANALLPHKTSISEPRYNLEVMLCDYCGLAQLKDLVDPVELFSDYVYFSSNSDTMLQSVANLTATIIPDLSPDAFVIEIASNDGYLLKNYVHAGFNVLGIDPAKNIADVANARGINTLCDFFSSTLAQGIVQSQQKAHIIHANNVMAHVPDINDFIKGLKILLHDEGQAIIEVPYFLDFVNKLEFDTIYHEHVYYFSVKSLHYAFKRHGLNIIDIEKLSIHGGSLRLFIMHSGKAETKTSAVVQSMIEIEEAFGLHTAKIFQDFMIKINTLKSSLTSLLQGLKSKGARIAAYGASAKGTTLLNYFGINAEFLDFIVDISSAKHGKFTPGTQFMIHAPDKLNEDNISHALLLSWNFADEILAQQQTFINKGGKFIIPLPEVKIIP